MVLSPKTLLQKYKRMNMHARFLRDDEARFVNGSSAAVRNISNLFSGAENSLDEYHEVLAGAFERLDAARKAMETGDLPAASRFLETADQRLGLAEMRWGRYVGASSRGARRAVIGLGTVAVGAAGVVTGGALGLAGAGAGGAIGLGSAAGVHGLAAGALYYSAKTPDAENPATSNRRGVHSQSLQITEHIPNHPDLHPLAAESGQKVDPDGRAPSDVKGTYSGTVRNSAEIERFVARALRSPGLARPVLPRSLEKLIAGAEEVLARFKTHRDANPNDPNPMPKDLGRFLIETQAAESGVPRSYSAIQRQWNDRAASYRTASTGQVGEDAVLKIRERLFADYLQLYSREFARLTDFIEGRGGNCEAQTQLILSAIAAAEVKLDPPLVFGVAVKTFVDPATKKEVGHLDAVIYNRDTREVFYLLDKKRVPIDAVIYDPHILYHAFLSGKDRTPPVPLNGLMIASPKTAAETAAVAGLTPMIKTNSRMSFPRGTSHVMSGEIPERAYISPSGDVAANETAGAGPENTPGRIVTGIGIDDVPYDTGGQGALRQIMIENGEVFRHRYDYRTGSLMVFREREQAIQYNRLKTDAEKEAFLVQLARQSMASALAAPETKTALEVFSNPASVKKYSARQLREAEAHAEKIILDLGSLSDSIAQIHSLGTAQGYEEASARAKEALISSSPVLRGVVDGAKGFQQRVARHPEAFVLLLAGLSLDKRRALLKTLSFDNDGTGSNTFARQRIAAALANPRIFGTSRRPGYAPTHSYIEVELLADTPAAQSSPQLAASQKTSRGVRGTKDRQGQPGRRSVGKAGNFFDPIDAKYLISEEDMAHLIMEFSFNEKVAGRWTPDIGRAFLQINARGKYDEEFLAKYRLLANAMPRGRRTTPDPMGGEGHPASEIMEKLIAERKPNSKLKQPPYFVTRDIAQILEGIKRRRSLASSR